MPKQSPGEAMMALHLRAHKIKFDAEYRFDAVRRWRFDFAIFPDICRPIGIEIDGGNRMAVMSKGKPVAIGRHTLRGDLDKLNAAAIAGYTVLRFTPAMVKDGSAIQTVLRALGREL